MIKLTASLEHWLWINHRELLSQILFGHTEVLSADLIQEYMTWCETEEGKSYLKGGENYHEPR